MQATYEVGTTVDPFFNWFYIFRDNNFSTSIAPHWHQGIELSFTIAGKIDRFTINKQTYTTTPGTILVVNSQVIHSLQTRHSLTNHLLSIIFPLEYVRRFYPAIEHRVININDPTSFSPKQQLAYSKLQGLLYRFCNLQELHSKNSLLALQSQTLLDQILLTLLSDFTSEMSSDLQSGSHQLYQLKRLRFITYYVEKHYREKLQLHSVASACSISKEYLARFFKKQMGISVNHYIANVRAEHARASILTSHKSLTQVAIENGFADTKAMNRAFQNLYQVSASQFKHQLQTTGKN